MSYVLENVLVDLDAEPTYVSEPAVPRGAENETHVHDRVVEAPA
jgi:hypothetical protein